MQCIHQVYTRYGSQEPETILHSKATLVLLSVGCGKLRSSLLVVHQSPFQCAPGQGCLLYLRHQRLHH